MKRELVDSRFSVGALKGTPRVTIYDVATECGVSIAAVSKVMNEPVERSRIAADTRRRVMEVAERLGYQPSRRAVALAKGQSRTVALLYARAVPWLTGIYASLLRALATSLHERSYRLEFVPLLGDPATWPDLLRSHDLDGAIVASEMSDDLGAALRKCRLPTVVVNALSDLPFPHILVDDKAAATELTRHLLSLGHRQITFFHDTYYRPHVTHYSQAEREAGCADAVRDAGLDETTAFRVVTSDAGELADAIAIGREPATAVVAYDDRQAVRLLGALQARGVAVPLRLSLATFNDVEVLQHVYPSITTMALPEVTMAREAADALLSMLDGSAADRPVEAFKKVLTEQLVVRGSTAPPPTTV